MKPCLNLFLCLCLCLSTLFLCGMDGCSLTNDDDPAVFIGATPPDGRTLPEDATILGYFDVPPSGLEVSGPVGVTFSVSNTTVTIIGGFKPGPLSLVLTWDDGSKVLNYTVENPTITEYDGENILFEQGNTLYEGYVVKGVSATQVLVLLEDRSEKTIHVDRIRGREIPNHSSLGSVLPSGKISDVFITLIPWDDAEDGWTRAAGMITGVYTDGTRKITIFRILAVLEKKWQMVRLGTLH